jgi:hypothetical protein
VSGVAGACGLAAEISEDRSRCAVAVAWRTPGGRMVAEIAWLGDPGLAPAEVARMRAEHEPVAVVVDGRSQSATLLKPLADAGVAVTQPSAAELAVATSEFGDLVASGRLAHLGQPELTEAVRGAQQRPLAGGRAWERRVQADQAPLVAATLAVWALLHIQPAPFFGTWR